MLQIEAQKQAMKDFEAVKNAVEDVKCLMAGMEVKAGKFGCLPDTNCGREYLDDWDDSDPNSVTSGVIPLQKWRSILNALVECLENAEAEKNTSKFQYKEASER